MYESFKVQRKNKRGVLRVLSLGTSGSPLLSTHSFRGRTHSDVLGQSSIPLPVEHMYVVCGVSGFRCDSVTMSHRNVSGVIILVLLP